MHIPLYTNSHRALEGLVFQYASVLGCKCPLLWHEESLEELIHDLGHYFVGQITSLMTNNRCKKAFANTRRVPNKDVFDFFDKGTVAYKHKDVF